MGALDVELCGKIIGDQAPCLLLLSHRGSHSARPSLWRGISQDPDSRTANKIKKAGDATPRGGAKGGYQNHVSRNSRVIVPFEHLDKVDLANYQRGVTIRLTVGQAESSFESKTLTNLNRCLRIQIHGNSWSAFVLYRSSLELKLFPPREGWLPAFHVVNDVQVSRRSANGLDLGHYLVRVPKTPPAGIVQGIFAPEYAQTQANYEAQLLLTHLAYKTKGHSVDKNLHHVEKALQVLDLYDEQLWLQEGIVNDRGITSCPLCGRPIASDELHETIDPSQVPGLANSGIQLAETRSTLINLYHLRPLLYNKALGHDARNVAWGHAHCNTFLAQRASFSTAALRSGGAIPNVLLYWDAAENFLRSDDGRAWVSITPVPPGPSTFTEYLSEIGLEEIIDADLEDE